MNKVIFGGAFDPIHLGHINMAEEASKKLDADVIFVPAPISVWKEESAPKEDKVKMVELSIQDYPRFSLDRYEIDSGKDTNYSIETAKYFVNKYPEDKFYYLIGADHVNAFHKWKEAKQLSEIVQIIFFKRPGIEINKNNIKEFNMLEIEGTLMDVSSTDIRQLKDLKVDESVMKYIEDNNLYYMKQISSYISGNRLIHSRSVANLSYQIAKANCLDDPEKYYIAGILHDIGKSYKDTKQFMKEYFPQYLDLDAPIYHQFVGAYIAEKDFGIKDEEILSAIRFHTTGSENMSMLAKVIYAADKIEPTRDFDSSELIDAMIEDSEQGFITVLKANIEFLESKVKPYKNSLTSKCVNTYLK